MSHAFKNAPPAAEDLPREIADLRDALALLPADLLQRISPALDQVMESAQRRRRILNLVQDALSQLRMDMKYMMFDLEATRRERDDYQRRLETEE